MPLFNPPALASVGGITVDAQGFVSVPGDVNAVGYKVVKEAIATDPFVRYNVVVKDAGVEKVIYNAER